MTKKQRPKTLSRPISDEDVFDLIDTTNRQYLEWLSQVSPLIDTTDISSDPSIDRSNHPLDLVLYTSNQRIKNALLE